MVKAGNFKTIQSSIRHLQNVDAVSFRFEMMQHLCEFMLLKIAVPIWMKLFQSS